MNVFKFLAPYSKAVVPVAVAAVLALLAGLGLTPDMTLKEAVTTIVGLVLASVGVYAVPNAKKGK